MRYKWKDIGLRLDIPFHILREFEEKQNPFSEVIYYWLNGNVEDVPVTWRSIVAVLASSTVEERGLAKTITHKYCQFESSPNNKG